MAQAGKIQENLLRNRKKTAADKLGQRILLCECAHRLRNKNLLNFATWDEAEQNIQGAKWLWADFPYALQSRISSSRAIHILREGVRKIQKEEAARNEEAFAGDASNMTGLCVGLQEFFSLSSALNEEPSEGFDSNDLQFSSLLCRLLAQAHEQQTVDATGEDLELDLEKLMAADVEGDVSGAVCSRGALLLRKTFEDLDCILKICVSHESPVTIH